MAIEPRHVPDFLWLRRWGKKSTGVSHHGDIFMTLSALYLLKVNISSNLSAVNISCCNNRRHVSYASVHLGNTRGESGQQHSGTKRKEANIRSVARRFAPVGRLVLLILKLHSNLPVKHTSTGDQRQALSAPVQGGPIRYLSVLNCSWSSAGLPHPPQVLLRLCYVTGPKGHTL